MIYKITTTVMAFLDDSFKKRVGLPLSKTVCVDSDKVEPDGVAEALGCSMIRKVKESISTECFINKNRGEGL